MLSCPRLERLICAAALATTLVSCTDEVAAPSPRAAAAALSAVVPTEGLVPGQSYFGSNGYIEYIPGTLPVIFSAPHGGALAPTSIPARVAGDACGSEISVIADANTQEVARAIQSAFFARTGQYPHVIINRLHRSRLDANRDAKEAACGNPAALEAWNDYHAFMAIARERVLADHGRGFYTDIHGHGHAIQRLELGYELTGTTLRRSDNDLDGSTAEQASSIRTFSEESPQSFSVALRGPSALGTLLTSAGYPSVPSQQDPAPAAGEGYFNGGYNIDRYACSRGGTICGVQIEANMTGVRDNAINRSNFAATLAATYPAYLAQFGINFPSVPAPAPGGAIIVQHDAAANGQYARFSATSNWSAGGSSGSFNGATFRLESGNLATPIDDGAVFSFYVSTPGTYTIHAWWPSQSGRSSSAGFRVFASESGPQLAAVNVNQQANGARWNPLGTWRFGTVGWARVHLSRHFTTTSGSLAADAVRATLVTGEQRITFGSAAPSSATVGGAYAPSATASSGLAVTFGTTTPAVCTFGDGVVAFVGAGTCEVTADQAGASGWEAAPRETQRFAIVGRAQTVEFTSTAPTPGYVGMTHAVAAQASSGLAVTLSSETPTVCSLSGASVAFVGEGDCTIVAAQAGSATWAAAEARQRIDVVRDRTAPEIVATVSGDRGADGWYVSDVRVTWSVTDGETPVSARTGCGAVTIDDDTAGRTIACTATSLGGTATKSVTIRRDATKPIVTYTGNAGSYLVDQTVRITCHASDATSGIATRDCDDVTGPAYRFELGANRDSATATDRAGNTGRASMAFTVRVTTASLCTLSRQWASPAGLGTSLCAMLDAAGRADARGDQAARDGALDAYRNAVEAQHGKGISSEHADILLRLVRGL